MSIAKDYPIHSASFVKQSLDYPWRLALAFVTGLLLILLTLYYQTTTSIIGIWWRSGNFRHAFLIVPICVFLIWRDRKRITHSNPTPNWRGLLILIAPGVTWLLADLTNVQVVKHLSLVGMIPVLVFSLLGWQAVRAMAFPLGFLFFAVPMGEAIVPPLIDFTAWFVVNTLNPIGVPTVRDSNFIFIPNGSFRVIQACSGFRYLTAALPLGTLYAYLNYQRLWRRVVFVALLTPLVILANGLRAFGIVLVGYLSEMRLATGVDHVIGGAVFYGIVMLLIFKLGRFWRESPHEKRAEVSQDSVQASSLGSNARYLPRAVFVTVIALILLTTWPLMAYWSSRPTIDSDPSHFALHAPPGGGQ